MTQNLSTRKFLTVAGMVLALSGLITAPIALIVGAIMALTFGNPFSHQTKPTATWLMAIAIVGLGADMNLDEVLRYSSHGIIYTVIGIGFTFAAGLGLGRRLNISKDVSCLITAGTAICGGSAIAAVSQVIGARSEVIAVSLGTVFLLNALALLVFPPVGHFFHLSQDQFGLWAGLAIHDTSSVVGAALQYGPEAAKVATTVKLARAVWIIPLAFVIGLSWRREDKKIPLASIIKRCWFIGGFILAAAIATYVPSLQSAGHELALYARRAMILVLYLIGLGMTKALLEQVGLKPFAQGIMLWILVSIVTLSIILLNIITI